MLADHASTIRRSGMMGGLTMLIVPCRQVTIDIKFADRRDVSTGASRMDLPERYVKSNALKKSVQAAWHMDNTIALLQLLPSPVMKLLYILAC
jgi:hypothetical protein